MLQEVRRITSGRSVLYALSGGVDSVVLLHLLLQCGVPVVAAHVEHGIRAERSMEDCAFVQALCEKWNVRLVTAHIDVPGAALASGRGLEETAREMRYAFLRQQKEKLGLDLIATAHHMNDQAETLLMHIIGGTSPAGLSGMRQEQNGLIRPLLGFTGEQIEAYARQHDLNWVQDETNADTAYTRNYIRHRVVPELEQVNPRAVAALGRLAELAAVQNDYLAQQAEALLKERMTGTVLRDIRDVHEGLWGVVLHAYLVRCGVEEPEQKHVARLQDLLHGRTGRRASIGGRIFERDAEGIRLATEHPEGCWPLHLGVNDTPLGRFVLKKTDIPSTLDLGRNTQVLDAGKAGENIMVRTKRSGDRVQLLGSSGSRLVSDVMTDRKIPRSLRGSVPLIVCGETIAWIAGIAPCRTSAIDAQSTQALLITYEKYAEE